MTTNKISDRPKFLEDFYVFDEYVLVFRNPASVYSNFSVNYFFLYIGFLIDFISGPVNAGFTSAVAILIIVSQIKDIIGVHAMGTTLLTTVTSIYRDLNNFRLGDAILGLTCFVVILLLRVSVWDIK